MNDSQKLGRLFADTPKLGCRTVYDAEGRLTYLHLYNGSLPGGGRLDLRDFPLLREVFVANCDITDTRFIEFPSGLTKLCLNGGRLEVADFTRLPGLEDLQVMGCSAGRFVFPPELKSLVITEVTENLPRDYTHLRALRVLSLQNNGLETLEGFRFPEGIEKLDIGYNPARAADLSSMTSLRELTTSTCEFVAVADLRLPKQIETVRVYYNPRFVTPGDLTALPGLRDFDVSWCPVTAIESASFPPSIRTVSSMDCPDLRTVVLEHLPGLVRVGVSGSGVERIVLRDLPKLGNVWLRSDSSLREVVLEDLPALAEVQAVFCAKLAAPTIRNCSPALRVTRN